MRMKECVVVSIDHQDAHIFGWKVGDIVDAVNGRGIFLLGIVEQLLGVSIGFFDESFR